MDFIRPQMWVTTSASARMCGLIQSSETTLPVERIGTNPSTSYPQKMPNSHPIHILEDSFLQHPYMGVTFLVRLKWLAYFSTCDPSYPQIIATYPQKQCLYIYRDSFYSPKCGRL